MFSQASIPHKQLCLYKSGERERRRERTVSGDDITLSCLLQLQPRGQDEVGGESHSALVPGRSYVHVFIRYIVLRLSTLRPSPSHPQSTLMHCAEHWFP